MDNDSLFVLALVLGLLAILSFVKSFADFRRPWMALVLALLSGGLGYIVVERDPERYTLENTDDVVLQVVGRLLN